jgi:hypothetical protein
MLKAVARCQSQSRQTKGDFVVALPLQWELFSLNGPHKQGFLFAVHNSKRETGMLIFHRRTLIGRSAVLSRISFNKPAITRLVAEKSASETVIWPIGKQPELTLTHRFEESSHSMRSP